MTEDQARALLLTMRGEYAVVQPQPDRICLDGDFSADQLEAVAWWLRNKPEEDLPR